jgi:hypothetical protein
VIVSRPGSTRIAALAEGRIVAVGSMSQVLESDHFWVKSYFRGVRGAPSSAPATPCVEAKPMETQARYTIVVGLFTLVIAAAGFVFVLWLQGFAGAGALALYRIRFEAPVIGLRPGVAVLFNGLRVGEVTSVRFDPADPKSLMARIAWT